MKNAGDSLVIKAGNIKDIGVKKQWLTKQDIEIEKRFQKLIITFKGNHEIFAEELNNQYIQDEHVWVIDPISHTFAFLHGLPHFAVVVSHLHKGETVFSSMYDPSVRELFVAKKNKGATLNGIKIQVNKNSKDLAFMFDPQAPAHRFNKQTRLDILSQLMDKGRNKTFGSAGLMYAYVACGRVNACIDLNKDAFTSIPGELLVTEAGGKVTDFYNKKVDIQTMGILATNGALHREMLEITKNY